MYLLFQGHIEWLQHQGRLNVSKQDPQQIQLRNDKTCPDRRADILSGMDIASIRAKYPLLFSYDQYL